MLDLDEDSASTESRINDLLAQVGMFIIGSCLAFAIICLGYVKMDILMKSSSELGLFSPIIFNIGSFLVLLLVCVGCIKVGMMKISSKAVDTVVVNTDKVGD